jgi:hypothetical protein
VTSFSRISSIQIPDAGSTQSRRKGRKIPSLLPTEMSFFLGSQDALSSTVLPGRGPPKAARPIQSAPQISSCAPPPIRDREKEESSGKDSRDAAGRAYSPRGAKLTALVAIADIGRSPGHESPSSGGVISHRLRRNVFWTSQDP